MNLHQAIKNIRKSDIKNLLKKFTHSNQNQHSNTVGWLDKQKVEKTINSTLYKYFSYYLLET